MVTFTELADWVEGRLDDATGERLAEAVAGDPELAASAAWLVDFRQIAAPLQLEPPPDRVRQNLTRLFAAQRPAPPSLRDRVAAVLSFDSALGAPALGMRAGASMTSRHLVLQSEQGDLAVDLYPEDRSVRVEGQVLPHDDADAADGGVELVRDGQVIAQAACDDTGRFRLPPVSAGQVLLQTTGVHVRIDAELVLEL